MLVQFPRGISNQLMSCFSSFVIFQFFCHHDGSGTGLLAEVEARDGCGYGGVGGAEGLGGNSTGL